MRTERRLALAALAAWSVWPVVAAAAPAAGPVAVASPASAVPPGPARAAGPLRVAVYSDNAPFSDDGKGIDVDVAAALARALGAAPEFTTFKEAETVDGDLRNVVWQGHYLRRERLADVMMHVPVDPFLEGKNPQVRIFAPYYRERLVVAREVRRIPNLPTLSAFTSEPIGVEFDTIEDQYLMTAFSGVLRPNVHHYGTIAEAVRALRAGEVAAVMGARSRVEAALAGAGRNYAVAPVPTPGLAITGWVVGIAVKADAPALADALARAMDGLLRSGAIARIFAARGLTYEPPAPAGTN